MALPGLMAAVGGSAYAGTAHRKLPMRFTWVACEPNCRGWIAAVGIVTTAQAKEVKVAYLPCGQINDHSWSETGYEGMKQKESAIPAPERPNIQQGGQWIVQLYEHWKRAKSAAEWRRKLKQTEPQVAVH